MAPIYKIMLVEDDETARMELKVLLQNSGYEVVTVDEFSNVENRVMEENPHLILMDLNLYGYSGIDFFVKIRDFSSVPVIFITSYNTTYDEIRCITIGGDDFIPKPYNIAILLGRINNVLRRTYGVENRSNIITYKGIEFNTETDEVRYMDNKIELTRTEARILKYLLENKDTYVSRISLTEYMWESKFYIDDNTLSVNISRIRKKFSDFGLENLIETKRGKGYKI